MPKTHPPLFGGVPGGSDSSGPHEWENARPRSPRTSAFRWRRCAPGVRQAELDAGERHDGLTSEELAELRRCGGRTRFCGKSGRSW